MSRSYRHFPKRGVGADSDKWYKLLAHRWYRAACRRALISGKDIPDERLYFNPWSAPKDGKFQFDPSKYPEMMRK